MPQEYALPDSGMSIDIPVLTPISTTARALDETLWALITRPGSLTTEEWAYLDGVERRGRPVAKY